MSERKLTLGIGRSRQMHYSTHIRYSREHAIKKSFSTATLTDVTTYIYDISLPYDLIDLTNCLWNVQRVSVLENSLHKKILLKK